MTIVTLVVVFIVGVVVGIIGCAVMLALDDLDEKKRKLKERRGY